MGLNGVSGEVSERTLPDFWRLLFPKLLGSQEVSQKKIIRLVLFQPPLIPKKELITVFPSCSKVAGYYQQSCNYSC